MKLIQQSESGFLFDPMRIPKGLFNTYVVFLMSICLSSSCSAQTTPEQSLLVLSKSNHTLSIVDPSTLKVVATMPVGADPHEVIASTDGKTAYVSIYGGGSLHEINILDLVGQKPISTFDTRPLMGPHGLYFIGGKVWFSAEGTKTVGRYDPATNKMDWCMGTGQDRTHMVWVSNDQKTVYTTNVSSATVSVLEYTQLPPPRPPAGAAMSAPPPGAQSQPGPPARSDWIQTIIPVAKGSEGFDVSPNGKELWTAGAGDGNISIINLSTKKVEATLDAKVNGANRLKFTPDGKLVLVSCLGQGDLIILDGVTRKEVKRVPIGHGAAGIEMDPNGSRAFVACTPDNYVAVVDLKSLMVTGHIDAGGGPDGMAWAARSH